MRPTSWGSARNRRARTGREAVEMAGVVLGYRASWHDRGPGGRSDSGCSKSRARPPPPQTGLDRIGLKSKTLLYNIGVSLSLYTHHSSPSTERCERRASRPTLALVDELTGLLIVPSGVTGWRSLALGDDLTGAALDVLVMVDELTGFHKSGPMPSMRPTSWGSARNRRARTAREAVKMAG